MSLTRLACLALLGAAGFVLASRPAPVSARQPAKDEPPRQPATYRDVAGFKSAGAISKDQLARAKDVFAAFARYNADYITNPKVYTLPQEFAPPPTKIGSEPFKTADDIIGELNRHLMVPSPFPVPPLTQATKPEAADYIRELGVALDDALKGPIRESNDRIVRINATRMLAAACQSGATAHYPTVTGLLTDAGVAPEVKYYALQAATNLLAAYDINDLKSRKHSAPPEAVAALVDAVQNVIIKPEGQLAIPAAAGGNLQTLSADQQQVVAFVRRQAVRALAQVRFAEITGVGGKPMPGADGKPLRPSFTLARVAVGDPALVPAPTTADYAEAVIGICNMAPPRGPATEPYVYAMVDVVASGVISFADRRASTPADKSLPWRGTAARLSEGMKLWQALFDQNFNPSAFNPAKFVPPAASIVPPIVTKTAAEIESRVLAPMADGPTGRVNLAGLVDYRNNTIRSDKKWTLAPYRDDPSIVLPKK